MNLKVVMIDDELLVRNHIRSLIDWERYGFELCGEASDGCEGMSLIRGTHPDIAIVDMSMPRMDGVQLIQQVQEERLEVKLIALSSYDSYDYVRGAMGYGAVDYLLKHRLNKETLLSVLHKSADRIAEERRHKQERIQEKVLWEKYVPSVTQAYVKELIIGNGEDLAHTLEPFKELSIGSTEQRYVLVLLRIMNYEILRDRMMEPDRLKFIRNATNLCAQAIDRNGYGVYLERGLFGLLLCYRDERSEYTIQQSVSVLVSRVKKSFELFLNVSVLSEQSITLSSVKDVPRQYPKLLAELMESAETVVHPRDSQGPKAISHVTIRHEKELLSAVEAGDPKSTAHVIRDIVQSAARKGSTSGRSVILLKTELLQLAAKLAIKSNVPTDWIYETISTGQKSESRLSDAESLLVQVYERLVSELRATQATAGYSRYVAEAIDAIHSEYRIGITLEEMADRLRITSAYLSRIFKEEIGRTFTEYLTSYRIERSQQMIRTQAYPIKELYTQVGFNNYSYFIKVFKQYTGTTPHVYARQAGKP